MEGPWDEIAYFAVFSAFLFIISPVIHEIFHAVSAELMGCSYSMHIGRMFGATELECFPGLAETFIFLSAGLVGSFILSQLLFIIAYESTNSSLSMVAGSMSSAILLSNGFSLFNSYNDITILGSIAGVDASQASNAAGMFLIAVALAEFAFIVYRSYVADDSKQ